MNRKRTKRIFWTIAVLFAMSLVAATVLRKHEEPKVSGDLSRADVSAISKLAFKGVRGILRERIRTEVRYRGYSFNRLIGSIRAFFAIKVVSIESRERGAAIVTLSAETYNMEAKSDVLKKGNLWVLLNTSCQLGVTNTARTTIAPVSSGAVR